MAKTLKAFKCFPIFTFSPSPRVTAEGFARINTKLPISLASTSSKIHHSIDNFDFSLEPEQETLQEVK